MEFFWNKIKRLEKEVQEKDFQISAGITHVESLKKENSELKKLIVQAADKLTKKEEDFNRTIEFMKLKDILK